MNFINLSDQGNISNPYAAKTVDGEWLEGFVDAQFLQDNFGQFNTATEMKNATDSEGLKMFFDYLVEQGKLQL